METKDKPPVKKTIPQVAYDGSISLDEFDTDEIVDYLENVEGYTCYSPGEEIEGPFDGDKVRINAIQSPNLKDTEMEQVLSELIAKYGYKLTDKLRELL